MFLRTTSTGIPLTTRSVRLSSHAALPPDRRPARACASSLMICAIALRTSFSLKGLPRQPSLLTWRIAESSWSARSASWPRLS